MTWFTITYTTAVRATSTSTTWSDIITITTLWVTIRASALVRRYGTRFSARESCLKSWSIYWNGELLVAEIKDKVNISKGLILSFSTFFYCFLQIFLYDFLLFLWLFPKSFCGSFCRCFNESNWSNIYFRFVLSEICMYGNCCLDFWKPSWQIN